MHTQRSAWTLRAAVDDIDDARARLAGEGGTRVVAARAALERAIALLAIAATDADLPDGMRDAAQRGRIVLSSHLLAADDLAEVGVGDEAVVSLLSRGLERTADEVRADGVCTEAPARN